MNNTTAIVPTTAVSRTNPCSQITTNPAAQNNCHTFFNNPTAAGTSSFAKAVVVSNAQGLISEVKNASPKGTIIVVTPGSYDLTEQLAPGQRVALIGVKTGETRPTIRMTSDLLKKASEANTLVYLTRPNRGASAGFYSAFINWETKIDDSDYNEDEDSAYTVYGGSYPGEIRLYDNTFIHRDKNIDLDEYVSLSAPEGKVVIDSNQFNTSNLYFSAVYSDCTGCGENEHEIIITNNTLTSTDGANNDSDYAFHLEDHKKFTIKNNTSLNSQANASMLIQLPNKPGLQSTIENNTADTGAAIEHRSIEIELKKDAMDNYKIAGHLTVSGNDYFYVDHEDEDGDYLVLTEGRKIPAGSSSVRVSLSLSPSSVMVSPGATTIPAAAKNPCNSLNHDATARKICNDFLNNSQASDNDKAFSHAFAVHNAQELLNAVERDHLDGTAFTGSIIVLRAGTYEIPRQLRINHKVALVGEKSGESLPEIKASKDIHGIFHHLNSLVHLTISSSQTTSGFYSTHIQWDTSIDNDIIGVVSGGAIGSNSYPGKIRIFENHFKHQGTKTDVYDFVKLKDSYGDTYIGHNTFDTTHLKYATVDARCVSCLDFDPKLEIVSNSLVSEQDSKRKTVSSAFEVKGYKRFWIENNQQKNSKAAAYIKVRLKNNTSGLRGFIRNNVALQTTPADQREIKVETFHKHGLPLNINGSLITTPNRHYSVIDPEDLMAHIGSIVESTASAQAPSTVQTAISLTQVSPTPAVMSPAQTQQVIARGSLQPSPTQAIPATSSVTPTSDPAVICDYMQSPTTISSSEINACKAFLKDEIASAGRSFSMAVVVSNAKELDEAVTGKFLLANADASKLIVLKSGTYYLTQSLNISHKIALVGTVKDGEYPVIRIADDFLMPSPNNRALAYLYDDATVAETGFYSHHIHWNTTNPPRKLMRLYMGAINSQSYQGELRFYENKFSESKHDYTTHYIRLVNAVGGAFIENNRFDTAYLRVSAISALCLSAACQADKPQLEILNNHFYSRHIAYKQSRAGSMIVRGYMRFKIIDNQQETKDAAGSIFIKDHINVKHMDGYILNNIAHKDAPEFHRRIIVESFFSPEQSVHITGKLHVAGNDYYKFRESGLAIDYVDYTAGKQTASTQVASSQTASTTPSPDATPSTVAATPSAYMPPDFSVGNITPTQLLVAVTASVSPTPAKKEPCNDIRGHAAAFSACKAFLKSELASGPDSDKPEFSHVILVNNSFELINAINKKTGDDGKTIRGSIILLSQGTYELSGPLQPTHRIATVGLKDKSDKLPVIKASGSFSASPRSHRSLLYLEGVSNPQNTGFYSWNLEWQTSLPSNHYYYEFESYIYAEGYSGDVRLYQNRFSHQGMSAWSRHSVLLSNNANHKYYIGHNTFDTSATSDGVVKSSARKDRNSQADIEVDANEFTTAGKGVKLDAEAILLSGYQRLKISNNIQKDRHAAGAIELTFYNHMPLRSPSVTNNRAHQDSPEKDRTIELKLHSFETVNISGYVEVTGNDYYEFNIPEELPHSNYRYTPGLRVGSTPSTSLTMATPSVTPSVLYNAYSAKPSPTQPVQATTTINSYGTPRLSPSREAGSVALTSVPTQSIQPLLQATPSIKTSPLSAGTTHLTPALKSFASSTQSPATTSNASTSTPPPLINSPCDQLSRPDRAQLCQTFLDKLQLMETGATFSEAVTVNTSQELVAEITSASDSGKIILLRAGSYEVDKSLHILNPVALVGIGNAQIKPSGAFPAEADTLVLLDDAGTGQGFFTKGITWTISTSGKTLKTAIKAIRYQGKLLMTEDDFQYHSDEESKEAPSYYIQVQDSSGDVLIADNTFFSGGLEKAAVFASCKECLTDDQSINIFGNHFTDSNHGESAPTAIDVRYYKRLNIHQNVQGSKSVSAHINIVLPNHKDDINAVIGNNVALGESKQEKRTIDLMVGRVAKEPVRIDGSVKVFNNRCFTVSHNGIPSHVLELIEGSCPRSPNAQSHIGGQSGGHSGGHSGGLSTAEWAGTGVAIGAAVFYGSCGLYGQTNWPGHARARSIFILPKTFMYFVGAKALEWYHQCRGYSRSENENTADGEVLNELINNEGDPLTGNREL
ncbi:hypothetical protein GZ77_18505 [Endozoicomonas montiporae]|uniref:Uncharacterized protein n=1 Tax=Endozoicomonas montiporae TaxID=1027273 RepID=A0A081N235_9GAMM|nr:hypothetical protein [Endozoicomonas montiporae]KEQ12508.1 hypothetical protein GZ77_18505 [Endozoicomonas montiporae]